MLNRTTSVRPTDCLALTCVCGGVAWAMLSLGSRLYASVVLRD